MLLFSPITVFRTESLTDLNVPEFNLIKYKGYEHKRIRGIQSSHSVFLNKWSNEMKNNSGKKFFLFSNVIKLSLLIQHY